MKNYCLQLGLVLLLVSTSSWSVESIGHSYTNDQITEGYGLYTDNCALCHGIEGSWVEGVDLSRGQFRSVVSDHDLSQVILEGAAEGRMPAFNFEDPQIDALIAYIRVGFDPEGAAVQIGDVDSGKSLFESGRLSPPVVCSGITLLRRYAPESAPSEKRVSSTGSGSSLSFWRLS